MERLEDLLRLLTDSDLDSIPGWSENSSISSIMSTTTDSTITINGETIEVNDQATPAQDVETALFKKEDREGMAPEKRQELFAKAATSIITKFDLLSANITDVKQLEECYNLNLMVSKIRSQHVMYDTHDVFVIVTPDGTGPTLSTDVKKQPRDLYSYYSDMTEEQVAVSNRWYSTWPKKSWYRENLMLTAKQLEVSMKNPLWTKVYERYKRFKTEEQGGPLLFIIMMKLLVTHTEQATKTLVDTVENLKISKVRGENVSKIVSRILGAHERLEAIEMVPEDFAKTVLKVLQTSSVEKFNKVFELIESQARIADALARSGPAVQSQFAIPSIVSLLDLAEKEYLSLCRSNDWTGAKTRGSPSSFPATSTDGSKGGSGRKGPVCWNCGGPHTLKDCTKPRNDALIEANRKKFNEARKNSRSANNADSSSSTSRRHKWRAPTADENNRREIDGKMMSWNADTRRWVALSTTTTPTASSSGTTPAANLATAASNRRVQIDESGVNRASTRRAMERTVQTLLTQFQDLE